MHRGKPSGPGSYVSIYEPVRRPLRRPLEYDENLFGSCLHRCCRFRSVRVPVRAMHPLRAIPAFDRIDGLSLVAPLLLHGTELRAARKQRKLKLSPGELRYCNNGGSQPRSCPTRFTTNWHAGDHRALAGSRGSLVPRETRKLKRTKFSRATSPDWCDLRPLVTQINCRCRLLALGIPIPKR